MKRFTVAFWLLIIASSAEASGWKWGVSFESTGVHAYVNQHLRATKPLDGGWIIEDTQNSVANPTHLTAEIGDRTWHIQHTLKRLSNTRYETQIYLEDPSTPQLFDSLLEHGELKITHHFESLNSLSHTFDFEGFRDVHILLEGHLRKDGNRVFFFLERNLQKLVGA